MAEVKKIATRDSYGNTLKELAAEGHDDLVVLDADLTWLPPPRPACSVRRTRTVTSTAVLQRAT